MGRIRVGVTIEAPRRRVWAAVRDVRSHTRWMADAAAIRLVQGRRNRVGAVYEVDTRVGPLRTLDVMEITEWRPRRTMGVRHVGVVTGSGRFVLRRLGRRRTRFTWEEEITLPWWLGGPLGRPVLRLVWARNLRRLKASVEGR